MSQPPSRHLVIKEDDDPILDYQNIETEKILSVTLGGFPFKHATLPEIVSLSLKQIDNNRGLNSESPYVFFMDPYRFVWMKNRKKYRSLAKNAFLNIPSGAGMIWMSKMLQKPLPELIPSVSYVMNMIRVAQAKKFNIFIVGGQDENLDKLAFNLKRSFPHLQIVGKHHGYLKKNGMERVVMALQKTQPHIILLGIGWKKEVEFILKNKERLSNSFIIPLGGILDILSGKRKKAPNLITNKNLVWLYRIINKPYRWGRIISAIQWISMVFLSRMFPKKNIL